MSRKSSRKHAKFRGGAGKGFGVGVGYYDPEGIGQPAAFAAREPVAKTWAEAYASETFRWSDLCERLRAAGD